MTAQEPATPRSSADPGPDGWSCHPEGLDLGGRVPLVVAVSGHRFLRGEQGSTHDGHLGGLRSLVESLLLELLVDPEHCERHGLPTAVEGLPESAWRPTPVVLLSGLAEGADRLVADVVLELRRRCPALQDLLFLVGVLPAALDDYLATFSEEADPRNSRSGFLELLGRCQLAYELEAMEAPRAPGPDGVTAPLDPTLVVHSAEQESYRRLGAFLVRNAHLLLALTDRNATLRETGGVVVHDGSTSPGSAARPAGRGLPAADVDADGGTTTVLGWFLGGLPPAYDPGALIVDRPVARVAVELWWPRARPTGPEETRTHLPATGALHELQSDVDTFNRDVLAVAAQEPATGRGLLWPTGEDHEVPGLAEDLAASRAAYRPLLQCFERADALASEVLRPRREAVARQVLGLAVLAIALFQAFCTVAETGLLVAYLAILAVVFCIWQRFQVARIDEKRIVYRSLAEALRVQVVSRHAGLDLVVPNEFARHSLSDLGWVRDALRGLFACSAPRPTADLAGEHQRVDLVHRAWVRHQGGTVGARQEPGPALTGLGLGAVGVLQRVGLVSGQDAEARRAQILARYDGSAAGAPGPSTALGWFERKARFELEPELRAWNGLVWVFSGTGVICAVALLPVHLWRGSTDAAAPGLEGLALALSIAVVNLFALAALCSAIIRVEAFQPLARHYREMAMIFRRADAGLVGLSASDRGAPEVDLVRRRRALSDLAREALGDDVRWSQLLRYRPLEVSPH